MARKEIYMSENEAQKDNEIKVEKVTTETKLPDFRAGDTIKVFYRVVEGDKTRIQPYEGIVISVRGIGLSKTCVVRRIGADNIAVERIFPMASPNIEKIEVIKLGK